MLGMGIGEIMKNASILVTLCLLLLSCSKQKKSDAVIAQEYDRQAVRENFVAHQKQYMACYQQALLKEKTARGKIVLDFVIMDDGFVDDQMVDRQKSTFNPYIPDFEKCLLAVLKTQKFPEAPKGIEMQIFYPMMFDNNQPTDKKVKE